MPISHDRHDLFRTPNTADKLNLLRSLSDAEDLTSDQALALINIIRAELEQPQKQTSSAYRRYSEVTSFLCKQRPEVYAQVVSAWQQRRRDTPSVENPPRAPMQVVSETTLANESVKGLEELPQASME